MYFTREEQIAPPEPIQASRNGSVQTSAIEEATNDYGSQLISSALNGVARDSRRNGVPQILRSAALSSRVNKGIRVVALSRAQRTHGNSYTQHLVSQIQLSSKNSQVIQRECACGGSCAKCSVPSADSVSISELTTDPSRRLIQAQQREASERGDSDREIEIPESGGEPIDAATRELMESRFGADFGDIRVHRDGAAAASADALEANAYTTGRDIYFASGKYAPGSPEGHRLLAHELTHTLQQQSGSVVDTSGSSQTSGIVIGAPDGPLEREADQAANTAVAESTTLTIPATEGAPRLQRDFRETASAVGGAIGGAARWGWNQTGGRAVRAVEGLVEDTFDSIRAYLERRAPGLMAFLRGNPIEVIKTKIENALDKSLGGILSRIQREGLWGALSGLAKEGFEALSSMVASAAADPCGALRAVIQGFIDFQKWEASTLWSILTKGAAIVADIFSTLWNDLAKPAWESIKKFAGAVWEWIEARATEFWNWIKPLRDLGTTIWNKVKQIVGVAWESGVDLYDWIKEKAKAAWDKVKNAIQPFIGPLKVAGLTLLLLSPLGPILVIGAAGYGIFQAAKWLYNNWDKLDIVIRARKILQEQIIPWIQSSIASLKNALKNAVTWLKEKAQALRQALAQLAEALGVNAFLSWAKSIVEIVRGKINAFADWVAGGFQALVDAVTPVLTKIWKFFQPILVVLVKFGLALANPLVWPIYIGAVIWMILPDCIKPPLIDYLMDIMIAAIRAIPNWGFFGEEWPQIKEAMAKALEEKRKASVEEKIRFSNKLANMIAGPELTGFSNLFEAARQSPDHFIGQVEKELIGMDLTEPLPLEQRPTDREGSLAFQAAAATDAGDIAAENAALLQRSTFAEGDVIADSVPIEEATPELLNSIQFGPEGSISFGQNPDPTITNESLRAELAAVTAAGGAPGPGGEQVMQRPPAELPVEDQIRLFVSQQPAVPCNQKAEPAPKAGKEAPTPAAQIFPPLTQSQRALFMWEQMKRGLSQWYECNKTAIIASLIAAAVLLVVLIILTDGVILEALPQILQVIGAIFIGVATVKMSMFIADYVFKAISGDISGAAKSLARGLAIGAIELLFYLLTAGSGKGAQKAGQRALTETAEAATKAGRRTARPFLEVAGDASRRFLANIKNPVGAFVRNGKVFIKGLERGIARGVRNLADLGERLLKRLGFRGFSIRIGFLELVVLGHFNASIVILRLSIRDALAAERRAAEARGALQRGGVLGSSAVAALPEAGSAISVSKFGAKSTEDLLDFAARNQTLTKLGPILPGTPATEAVVQESRRMALQIAQRVGRTENEVQDILRQMGALSDDFSDPLRVPASHAERQLAVVFPNAKALGSSREVCPACQTFFSTLAQSRGAGLVIADPQNVWIFLANGRYASFPRATITPLLAEGAEPQLRAFLQPFLSGATGRPPVFP